MSLPLLLFVDDAPEIGLIVRHLGKRGGYQVEYRTDGEAAIAYLRSMGDGNNPRPNLLILDYHLAGCNGAVWCRRIRALPEWADLPLGLFSHWTVAADLADSLEAGVNYIFSKESLSDPEGWQTRMTEVLIPVADRAAFRGPGGEPLDLPAASAAAWRAALATALQHPVVRHLGAEVIQLLCQRAWQQSQFPVPGPAAAPPQSWESFTLTGLGLGLRQLPAAARPVFGAALAEQIGCVLGFAASAPFRVALAAALGSEAQVPGGP